MKNYDTLLSVAENLLKKPAVAELLRLHRVVPLPNIHFECGGMRNGYYMGMSAECINVVLPDNIDNADISVKLVVNDCYALRAVGIIFNRQACYVPLPDIELSYRYDIETGLLSLALLKAI